MQALELGACVAHVAAHRRIGPLGVAVAVEAHVQLDQAGDRRDRVVVEAQRLHALLHDLGAHGLVVAEGDGAVGAEAARRGLAHVVQQRGQPQDEVRGRNGAVGAGLQIRGLLHDGQRVLVDVLVVMGLIGLELQRGHLRQHHVGQAGIDHDLHAAARGSAADQLDQLLAHPLGRDDLQALVHLRHGRQHLRSDLQIELRGEARGPHHPQGIVVERRVRGARGAQHAGGQVPHAAVRVHQLHRRQPKSHRVDGEVAPDQVVLEAVPEGHDGLAGGGVVGLGPVRGDLELLIAPAHPDRAEVAADLPGGIRPSAHRGQGLIGGRVRGEVEVRGDSAQEEIAHGAAHEREVVAGRGEAASCLEDDGRDGGGVELLGHRAHHSRTRPARGRARCVRGRIRGRRRLHLFPD